MDKQGPPPPAYTPPGWTQPPVPTPAQTYQPATTYQPAATYQPAQTAPGAAIIITRPPPPHHHHTPVGPTSSRITCPSCHAEVQTKLRHEPTTKTHLMALCLFCFLCWPCVCLPYCMDSCQNANHYCPNCNAFIGTYES